MTTLTKKHFEAIAEAINTFYKRHKVDDIEERGIHSYQIDELIDLIGDKLYPFNKNFNRLKFKEVCLGLKEETKQ